MDYQSRRRETKTDGVSPYQVTNGMSPANRKPPRSGFRRAQELPNAPWCTILGIRASRRNNFIQIPHVFECKYRFSWYRLHALVSQTWAWVFVFLQTIRDVTLTMFPWKWLESSRWRRSKYMAETDNWHNWRHCNMNRFENEGLWWTSTNLFSFWNESFRQIFGAPTFRDAHDVSHVACPD